MLKDHMQVKDINVSIIHSHEEYQALYLDITMRIGTTSTHAYGQIQMVNENSIIDNIPRVKNYHGEF